MNTPILQFGTSRFLQAHVDLFVSEALAAGDEGQALGGIAVVQTTGNPASSARVAALASGEGYPVRIRGLQGGVPIDRSTRCTAVKQAVRADQEWPRLIELATSAQVFISNTADQGYRLDAEDGPTLITGASRAPRSFPAKLAVLLHHRWKQRPDSPLTIYPCELVERNGSMLRDLVITLAREWALPPAFTTWLSEHLVWVNSLVDRIVSEALLPVGAVAEPYALWAIEQQPRMVLPCRHPAIVVTTDLERHERLKLFLLNAGHSFLAERWQQDAHPADMTVRQAMDTAALRRELEALWADEIVPVLAALGQGDEALSYLVPLRERLLNPFLEHRLADIAQNHAQKKQRRLGPILTLARRLDLRLPQPRLTAALAS